MGTKKALIAMSGGVDSSVAARFMLDAGYDCIGCTMRLWEASDGDSAAIDDARGVATSLGMEFHVLDLRKRFEEAVICPFVSEYEAGRTPNPCIECNRNLKFGRLFDFADELGCEMLATGHYARVERSEDGKYLLKKALDETKDQSYVLYMLGQDQLRRLVFPLGEVTKSKAREIATESGFANADRPDSQDICFVPDGDYASVITARGARSEPGEFVTADGTVLGEHRGLIHYTVGQRKHLGISYAHPLYVIRLDVDANRVIVGDQDELFSSVVKVRDVSWVAGDAPATKFRCRAKIRYRKREEDATAVVCDDGSVVLNFDEPQRAPCPGQSAVMYDGDIVIGGGKIEL